jgi:hypothetical protein
MWVIGSQWTTDRTTTRSRSASKRREGSSREDGNKWDLAAQVGSKNVILYMYYLARVLGILAVTRSFGDHGMKDFVIAEPHLAEVSLAALGDCPFAILACDGVWDVLTDQEAVELILTRFQREGPFEDAAKLIVSYISCHIFRLNSIADFELCRSIPRSRKEAQTISRHLLSSYNAHVTLRALACVYICQMYRLRNGLYRMQHR